ARSGGGSKRPLVPTSIASKLQKNPLRLRCYRGECAKCLSALLIGRNHLKEIIVGTLLFFLVLVAAPRHSIGIVGCTFVSDYSNGLQLMEPDEATFPELVRLTHWTWRHQTVRALVAGNTHNPEHNERFR